MNYGVANVSYLKVFGRKCYILKETRKGKFDVKSYEGIFLGCFSRSKAYKCLNITTHKIIESAHVKIDDLQKRVKKRATKNLKIT